MNNLREAAYRLDPVLWVLEILGITPTAWQETFLRSPRGSSILALTARQVGKTTTAAWAIAHSMVFTPGSLSVIACPAQRQSAEAVRRVREILLKVGAKAGQRQSLRWNWTTARACWRCRAATTRSNWAARHPHLELWIGRMVAARRPRRPRQTHGWGAFT